VSKVTRRTHEKAGTKSPRLPSKLQNSKSAGQRIDCRNYYMPNYTETLPVGQTEIIVEYPDFAADNSTAAPTVQRKFSGELARVLAELIDAGRYGVPRSEIPKRLIPELVRNGLFLTFFADPAYGDADTRRPQWARLQAWGMVKLVAGVA
jgi:hypothetical protein